MHRFRDVDAGNSFRDSTPLSNLGKLSLRAGSERSYVQIVRSGLSSKRWSWQEVVTTQAS